MPRLDGHCAYLNEIVEAPSKLDTAISSPKKLCPQPVIKKVSHKAPKVKAIHKDDATPQTPLEEELSALDTRIALIQALIPLVLDAVAEELQIEVSRLAGQDTNKSRVKLLRQRPRKI